MKNKKISLMIVGGISAVIFVVFSMFIYVNYVQDSLWDKSINDILETTSQEEKAFNVYMTKEMTNSQNILTNIAYLQTKIPQYLQHLSNREEAKYLYIDYTNDCYYDENGNYLENSGVLQEHIREYVNMLGEKYNTVGKPRTITSTSTGQPVSVEGGTYGFRIDAQAERQQLLADIQAHAKVEREPVYARRGAVYGANDLGGTYVEIDLTAQHLWYYKDGMLLMDSDFVSGTYYDYSRQTPGGTYTLKAKQRNQVLRPAPNEDGSYDYESPVSYWLPFNGGIGLHDANWRWNFGGNIYLYGGSHGCINLPVSFAGNFYENIEVGCPIVCFYR